MSSRIRSIFFCLLLGIVAAFPGFAQSASSVTPVKLTCEYLTNPLGLDELYPRLSWNLRAVNSSRFGQKQTAYRILVSGSSSTLASHKGDRWDSGWVTSDEMQLIAYKGSSLQSDQTYYWKVCTKDEKGRVSAWSKPAFWATGLLKSEEWKAKWIGTAQMLDPAQKDCNIWDPWLRKTFDISSRPKRAMLFLASVGYHEVYVNGKKIGDDILAPAVTNHRKRARYVAYDIAGALLPGKNVIAIWLGTSWSIFGPYGSKSRPNTPIVIAQAAIGSQLIATDESWKTHHSPNKLLGHWDSHYMGGELWDANKEMPDWNLISCKEEGWGKAIVYQPDLLLSAQQVEGNRLFTEIRPKEIVAQDDGSYRVDMGVNFAGWTSINVAGKPGDRIDFQFSERRKEAVTFGLYSAFIIGPKGIGTFRNRFNYSSGRWITIRGLKKKPSMDDIKGWLVRTNYKATTTFESADSLQNWIYNTVKWTFENLSLGGYVVDCPQRERLGYGGDAHSTAETGMFNYRLGAFYTKWMEDWRDVQGIESMSTRQIGQGSLPHTAPTMSGGGGPAWGGIVVTLPWFIYQQEGDVRILETNFQMIKDWLAFLDSHTSNDMLKRFGAKWDFLGDWLWPNATAEGMNNSKPASLFFNNCYRVFNLRTASKIAVILNKDAEAKRWAQQAEASSAAIHAKYFNAGDHSYADSSMSNLSAALFANIMPEEMKPVIMARLEEEILIRKKGHIHVGITGGAMLFKVLRDAGRDDLIYSMTSQTNYPGWGYMKANDATTLWEMWEKDLRGHSLLHSSYLYPGAWYIDGVAGIKRNPDYPGFRKFILRPPMLTEEQLSWAKAVMQSPAGEIKASWKRKSGILEIKASVPPNCRAILQIPETEGKQVTGDTKYLIGKGVQEGFRLFELSAGHYNLKFFK
jgi:alpha-L-rhamnosidase